MATPIVRYVRKMAGHPTEGLSWLAGKDQIERGFRDINSNVPGTNWDYEAVWIDIGGECVAMISFKRQDWNRTISTGWSFTMPEHRRKGYNKTLFAALEGIAARDGYGRIERGTHSNNTEMRDAFADAGGVLNYVHYSFAVETDRLGSINDRYEFP